MRKLLLLTLFTVACGGKSTPAPNNASTEPVKAANTHSCPAGHFMANDDACLKECAEDKDCAENEMCEQIRDVAEDGTTGPVLGSGCTAK